MVIQSVSSDAITDNAGALLMKKERIGACWLKPTALRDGGLINPLPSLRLRILFQGLTIKLLKLQKGIYMYKKYAIFLKK